MTMPASSSVAKNFSGIGDPGECQDFAPGERGERLPIRLDAAVKDRQAAPAGSLLHDRGAVARADSHERLRACELGFKRRPQRAGRKNPAVADAAPAVDEQNRKVFLQ